ncbi:GGDEF domain-containing protein [Rhizobium sp. XQZ8]|uniref:GGDEF domain-containing protein n=1 Tax=Rhizobium populisoli TaxID=2859785 RepID=UPI001C683461|nr:GGDEF domain-containing protein [Rhizobium populisoli]MBW6420414.1 GGDEF domain-containing protein [Rhizobium populisoli]
MDIVTGLMIWAAEALTLAVLLWSRWLYERDAFYLSWGGGFALHGVGVALVALRGDIPDFVSIQIANTMVLAGIGFWIAGLQQFDGKRIDPFVAIPALIWIAGMFLYPIRESFANRTALGNGASMIGYGIMIAVLLRNESVSTTRRFLAASIGVQFLASGLIAIFAILHQTNSFSAAPKLSWLFFPAAFCFIASIMSGAKLLTERSEEKLKALAVTDPLTGVLNRRGLIDEFHGLIKADSVQKPMIALLHFDLDSFKQINDRCGHQAGDAVLVAFSRVGQTSLRGRGFFGRMGGEEFASILRVSDLVEAASIAEAIRLTLKRQIIETGDHRITVTVSAGISLMPAQSADLDTLLSAADRALYHAKESGRDRTAIDVGTEATIIPAIDRSGELDEQDLQSEMQANHQVAALKRLASLSKH